MTSRSRSDEAYDLLKREILECKLSPGERVSSALLTDRYELGLAPVRSALGRLVQEDLVRALPREGYLVSPVTMNDAHELFEAREVVETWTVQRATSRMTNDRLSQLRQLASAEPHFTEQAAGHEYRKANYKIHMTLAETAGNDYITATLANLMGRLERLLHLSHRFFSAEPDDSMYQNHEDLIALLEKGDGAGASEFMRKHIRESKTFVIVALTKSPNLVSVNITDEKNA